MIHWLLRFAPEIPELAAGGVPEALLSPAERQRLAQITVEKRRREWLLGRCAAKSLARCYVKQETGQEPPPDALVIAREAEDSAAPIVVFDSLAVPQDLPAGSRWVRNAPLVAEPGRRRGLPVPRVSGWQLPISLSISHRDDVAFCALYAPSSGGVLAALPPNGTASGVHVLPTAEPLAGSPADDLARLGVDIEAIEPREESFLRAYFAPEELCWLGQASDEEQPLLAAVIWSAKEAVLKALHLGLTVDAQQVVCLPASGLELGCNAVHGWCEVYVHCPPDLVAQATQRTGRPVNGSGWSLSGWWRRHGSYVLTVALLAYQGETAGRRPVVAACG
ncbi:MAG: 4'-phosphopantetheinyl transferase superfamily protein [Caldilineales bacterium]|nr:4'-phosphopantetheinyl transferase superfamily protein [Caldilineales bacterium]MDW8316859.1 4'-phosphopantetheinyl transferase superfamily protein [Anaerolineae bacterium]